MISDRIIQLPPSIMVYRKIVLKVTAALGLLLFLSSCKTQPLTTKKQQVFELWNSLEYPYSEISNQTTNRSLADVLSDNDLAVLEQWRKSTPMVTNFYQAECMGCSNATAQLRPLYKTVIGKYIHFGFEINNDVEHFVFKKNGEFISRLFMFQGDSKEQVQKEIKAKNIAKYQVLESIYPTQINKNSIAQNHLIYQNQNYNEGWYNTPFPTEIAYQINFKKKSKEIPFQFKDGVYSYQKTDKNGNYRTINFFNAIFSENAQKDNTTKSFSAFIDGYAANVSFFRFSVEEKAAVSIDIKSNSAAEHYEFSVLKNDGFYTIDEYVNRDAKRFFSYQKQLNKGDYLIRIQHHNADYSETPLYGIKITKNIKIQ